MKRLQLKSQGTVLIAALLCLLVVMLLCASIARSMVTRQRVTRLAERQAQCFWLMESAAMRAAVQARSDPAYIGEPWRVSVSLGGRTVQGVADIEVEAAAEDANERRIRIHARWPDDPVERVTRRKEFTIQLAETGAA